MKCPFLKETTFLSWEDIVSSFYEAEKSSELFKDCIGKECMAFNNGKCKLIDKDNNG